MERKRLTMILFAIGAVVGIAVAAIAFNVVQYKTQPMIGALLVDKTDKDNVCLYLKIETHTPAEIADEKYVTLKVKNVDYFADDKIS